MYIIYYILYTTYHMNHTFKLPCNYILQCSYDVLTMFLLCTYDVLTMYLRCTYDVLNLYLRYIIIYINV